MFNSYQEAYDKTVEFLEAQGQRSYDYGSGCKYKSGVGCCAVGFHIQPVYSENMDSGIGNNVYGLFSNFPQVKTFLDIKNISEDCVLLFWSRMQNAHDSSIDLAEINKNLEVLAEYFKLKPKQLTRWVV